MTTDTIPLKMIGRKRLPVGTARTASIIFRLTETERAAITARSEAAGLPLREYARAVLLNAPLPPARTVAQRQKADLVTQLVRIGNNLNQIARALNTDSATPRDLSNLDMLILQVDALLQEQGA
jgi:hypothetical protein